MIYNYWQENASALFLCLLANHCIGIKPLDNLNLMRCEYRKTCNRVIKSWNEQENYLCTSHRLDPWLPIVFPYRLIVRKQKCIANYLLFAESETLLSLFAFKLVYLLKQFLKRTFIFCHALNKQGHLLCIFVSEGVDLTVCIVE